MIALGLLTVLVLGGDGALSDHQLGFQPQPFLSPGCTWSRHIAVHADWKVRQLCGSYYNAGMGPVNNMAALELSMFLYVTPPLFSYEQAQ